MTNKWYIQPLEEPLASEAKDLAKQLHISELSARLLVRRGIHTEEEAKQYVRPSLADLNDSFLMRDMDKAVERKSAY